MTSRLWTNLRIKENFLRQKARLKWDTDGDSNNKFFHGMVKERRRRNYIGNLLTNKGLVKEVGKLRKWYGIIMEGRKFVETDVNMPILEGVKFNSLSLNQAMCNAPIFNYLLS